MKRIFITLSLIGYTSVFGQIKTNNIIFQEGANGYTPFLDASSSQSWNSSTNNGKGLVFPRTDLTTLREIKGPSRVGSSNAPTYYDGMVVYNTVAGTSAIGNVKVKPGFYYYENKSRTLNGGTWKALAENVTGAKGADGKTILNGTTAPAPNTGKEGDFYIDTAANKIYGPKTSNGWGNAVSIVGPKGADGKSMLSGTGNPGTSLGSTGDTYIDTNTGDIWSKSTGTWVKSNDKLNGVNLYTANGALTSHRTVDMNGKNLVFNGGYIGIGNSLPTTAIHVQGSDDTNSSITLERNFASIRASATLEFNKSRGTNTAKTAVVNKDALGSLMFRAYNGTSFINSAQILSRVDTDGNIENAQAIPSSLFFSTTNDGEEDESIKMTLNKDGKLGVGMASRPQYSLSVSTPHTGLNYTKADGIFLLNKLTLNEKAGIRSIGGVEISSDFEGNFPSSGVIAFNVSNQEHMRVTSDGNVGIGTQTPTEKLEVNGNVKVSSLAESGGGNRPVYADADGKLVIGTAGSGRGNSMFSGYGNPNENTNYKNKGVEGDTYLDLDTGNLWIALPDALISGPNPKRWQNRPKLAVGNLYTTNGTIETNRKVSFDDNASLELKSATDENPSSTLLTPGTLKLTKNSRNAKKEVKAFILDPNMDVGGLFGRYNFGLVPRPGQQNAKLDLFIKPVSPNGKKLTDNTTVHVHTDEITAKKIQIGGEAFFLNKLFANSLDTNTAKITKLPKGSDTDAIVVADGEGNLKKIDRSQLNRSSNYYHRDVCSKDRGEYLGKIKYAGIYRLVPDPKHSAYLTLVDDGGKFKPWKNLICHYIAPVGESSSPSYPDYKEVEDGDYVLGENNTIYKCNESYTIDRYTMAIGAFSQRDDVVFCED